MKILSAVEEEIWSEESHWALSGVSLTPDGKELFFAANAGTGLGAPGGTNWGYFAVDLATRKLNVLSALGSLSGRMPEVAQVSPDGLRLAFMNVGHGGYFVNPRPVYVVDLLTQQSRELLNGPGNHEGECNLTAGPLCWSPDSRYVALDVLYYDVQGIPAESETIRSWIPGRGRSRAVSANEWKPRINDYAVLIFDAATGRQVRELPAAHHVSWSR